MRDGGRRRAWRMKSRWEVRLSTQAGMPVSWKEAMEVMVRAGLRDTTRFDARPAAGWGKEGEENRRARASQVRPLRPATVRSAEGKKGGVHGAGCAGARTGVCGEQQPAEDGVGNVEDPPGHGDAHEVIAARPVSDGRVDAVPADKGVLCGRFSLHVRAECARETFGKAPDQRRAEGSDLGGAAAAPLKQALANPQGRQGPAPWAARVAWLRTTRCGRRTSTASCGAI